MKAHNKFCIMNFGIVLVVLNILSLSVSKKKKILSLSMLEDCIETYPRDIHNQLVYIIINQQF